MATENSPNLPRSGDNTTIGVLGALMESVDRLEATAKQMASKEFVEAHQRQEERRRRNFALLVIAVGTCFLMMFVLLTYGLYELTDIGEANRENTDVLVECTSPRVSDDDPHECFEENQRRTGEIMGQIMEGVRKAVREEMRKSQR